MISSPRIYRREILDKLLYNGNIYSIDSENRKYTALGIEDGKITFLGNDQEALQLPCEEKIDLNGKTLLPGLIDSHLHMLNYAFVNTSYPMFAADSIDGIIEEGKKIIAEKKFCGESDWLYGRGWNELNFKGEKRILDRFDLDKISTTVPILFIRVCGHLAAVNTKALQLISSLDKTKEYIHQIDMEKGILTEASVKLCYDVMTVPSVEQLKEMITFAQKEFNKAGITSVHSDNFLSLPGRPSERIITAYKQLAEEEKLTVKVYEEASFTSFEDMKAFIDRGYRTGQGSDYYKIGPIKLYQDGSLGAKTALMNHPYLGEDNCGIAVHDAADLQRCVDYAYSHDMQILIHAIGDKAADMVCTAYENTIEKFGKKEKRLAINHLQIVSDDLFDRMKANDILAFIQPIFVASDKKIIASLVGEEVAQRSYLWKTMLKKGLICCGGSDAPVERFDVLENIQVAVTRDALHEKTEGWHPQEKLSVLEALRMFTISNAYASFDEQNKGSLEIGKAADLVLLSNDPFTTDAHSIAQIQVLKTYVDGKEVYSD